MLEQALLLKYAEQYAENRPYHMKYYKSKHKDAVFRKYESQLILYNTAKEMLKKSDSILMKYVQSTNPLPKTTTLYLQNTNLPKLNLRNYNSFSTLSINTWIH